MEISKELSEYGYIGDNNWFNNQYAQEIYHSIENNIAISEDLKFKFVKQAKWNIPIIMLLAEIYKLKDLEDLPYGLKVVCEIDDSYYCIRPRSFVVCVKLRYGDTNKTIKELFTYAMNKWGIKLSDDFTVITREEYSNLISKQVRFEGLITTEDIRRFIEEIA